MLLHCSPPAVFCFLVPISYSYHVLLSFSSPPHSFCFNIAVALLWLWPNSSLWLPSPCITFFFFLIIFTHSLSIFIYQFLERGSGLIWLIFSLQVASLAFGQPMGDCPGSSTHPLSNPPWVPKSRSLCGCTARDPLPLKSRLLINVKLIPHTRKEWNF